MVVYKATNLINGKVYIGSTTVSMKERKRDHIYHSKINDNKRTRFQKEFVRTLQNIVSEENVCCAGPN